MAQDEDAAELRLGEEFATANCLMNSEVAFLLQHRLADVHETEQEAQLKDVFHKTLDYVERFSRFKNKVAVESVRELLSRKGLAEFEIAQIGNLNPADADEAKVLIPSLNKELAATDADNAPIRDGSVDDEMLANLLQDLAQFRRYR